MPAYWAIWEWSVVTKNILIRYLSLRRMNIPYFCPVPLAIVRKFTQKPPDPGVEVYQQGIWVISPRFRHVSREAGECSYRADPRDAYEHF